MKHSVIFAAGFAMLISSSIASAHIAVIPKQGLPGTTEKVSFRITHGCKGSPTKTVRVQIPSGVLSVKPQVKANWKLEIKKETLKDPIKDNHGNVITHVVSEVSWKEGSLADEFMDEFSISLKLPNTTSETLYFPLIQECETGSHKWIQIPKGKEKANSLDEPAPTFQVQAAK